MVNQCSEYFQFQGQASKLPNCSAIDPNTGTPVYPNSSCNNASSDAEAPYTQADCPYPLLFIYRDPIEVVEQQLTPSYLCVYPCPDPMFSKSEWESASALTMVLGGFSMVLMLFLTITLALQPHARRFPASGVLWIAVTAFIFSISIELSVFVGGLERTQCTWDYAPIIETVNRAGKNGGQGVVCILQGILIYFTAIAVSLWITMMSIASFQLVFLNINSEESLRKLKIASHIIVWGGSSISTIIALGAQQYDGQMPAGHNCFLSNPWDLGLFYSPVILLTFLGTILTTPTIIKVMIAKIRFWDQSKITFEMVTRIACLVLLYWAIYSYITIYRLYVEGIQDTVKSAVMSQIKCSASTGKQCALTEKINTGTWYLEAIIVGAEGIIIFCCVGLTKRNLYFWLNIWKKHSPKVFTTIRTATTVSTESKTETETKTEAEFETQETL